MPALRSFRAKDGFDVPRFSKSCHLLAGSKHGEDRSLACRVESHNAGEDLPPVTRQRGLPREADLSIVVPQRGTKLEGLLRGQPRGETLRGSGQRENYPTILCQYSGPRLLTRLLRFSSLIIGTANGYGETSARVHT
jgi:hypothetical protein